MFFKASRQPTELRQRQEQRLRHAERHIRRGRLRQAIALYRQMVADDPADLASLNRIGDLLIRSRRAAEACPIFLQVAARYAAQGFAAKAIAMYRKVLRCDPTEGQARRRLGELYRQRDLPIPLF